MMMIKQCKAKQLEKIPISRLIKDSTPVIVSTKYDGNYLQIHKTRRKVKFFTSGGKELYFKDLAEVLLDSGIPDVKFECEYIGLTDGRLGSRAKCSTGHYRSEFNKGNTTNLLLGTIKVFDILDTDLDAYNRMLYLKYILNHHDLSNWLEPVDFSLMEFRLAKIKAHKLVADGWEGVMVKTKDHIQLQGKRVNNSIKLKNRPSIELVCIDVLEGKGKYKGKIGSLRLKDEQGIVVDVGSGLSDYHRDKLSSFYLGKTITIGYEQLLDTYIQPVFLKVV